MDRGVVITGSTRGIGRGLAEAFLERGCKVMLCGRDEDRLLETMDAFSAKHPGRVAGQICDVTNGVQLDNLWQAAATHLGSVDVWINNAGAGLPRKPLPEQDADAIRDLINVNVTGTLLGCRAALKGMRGQGKGFIFNMEGFGSNGMTAPGMAAYGASKSAISYLTKALRDDAKDSGVKIGVISPGIVATDLLLDGYDFESAEWKKAKRILNILGDRVETVAPWIAGEVLKAEKDGIRIAWLTGGKAASRFATSPFRRRNIFAGTRADAPKSGK